ncbi:hypothetical protein EAF00_006680 [Botryotinia globosa]|nr:hypothetical protein EAF00_006680 [Botryotinia globosa]
MDGSLKWATGSQKIFWSRDADPAQSLWDYTKGKGIDVILCNARDEAMHNYWCRIAPMGRFVEIGRTEVLEKGKLGLAIFRQTATFASFDLEVTCNLGPKVIGDLDHFKRVGLIRPLPHTTYHVSEIDKALMTLGKGAHIRKFVVGYEQRSSTGLKVRSSPFRSKFDPNAVYLKPFSASFDLQGVSTQIVQGVVASLADVKSADGLFSCMTLDQFESTQAMIRNGFYGNEEDDFLQYCDAGIGPASQTAYDFDPLAQEHLLVGIKPAGLQEIN